MYDISGKFLEDFIIQLSKDLVSMETDPESLINTPNYRL